MSRDAADPTCWMLSSRGNLMSRINDLSVKIYRMLFVLPPAASFGALRRRLQGEVIEETPPLPHPIDRQYGIDTSGNMGFDQLRAGSPADIYQVSYGGSQPSIIRRVLGLIPNLDASVFLDLGCGKGRALAVASEFPFRRLVGVELAPVLVKIARANAEHLGRCFPLRPPIRVDQGDAATTQLPEGQVVVYFFHPFFRGLMKRVLANLENGVISGRISKLFVVYYNPVYADLYDWSPVFQRYFVDNLEYNAEEAGTGASYHDRGDAVAIWQSRGEPQTPAQTGAAAKIVIEPPGWRARVVR